MHSLETLCSSTSQVDFHHSIPAMPCIASTSKTVLRSSTQKTERLQVLMHVTACEQYEWVSCCPLSSKHACLACSYSSLNEGASDSAYAAGIDRVRSAAGHGSQTADWSGDEDDGMNETICPCDFQHVWHHLDGLHFVCYRVAFIYRLG